MRIYYLVKRIVDMTGASILLVVTLPLSILIATVIYFTDGRPILLGMERCARYPGGTFAQIKFRTMYNGNYKFTDFMGDNRVIPSLKWIRKLNLDSLPELINVFNGEMSLIGPRPFPMNVMELLKRWPGDIEKRRSVRPGLFGLSQVRLTKYDSARQKLKYDCQYVDNIGFRLDMKILLESLIKTIFIRWNKHEV